MAADRPYRVGPGGIVFRVRLCTRSFRDEKAATPTLVAPPMAALIEQAGVRFR